MMTGKDKGKQVQTELEISNPDTERCKSILHRQQTKLGQLTCRMNIIKELMKDDADVSQVKLNVYMYKYTDPFLEISFLKSERKSVKSFVIVLKLCIRIQLLYVLYKDC